MFKELGRGKLDYKGQYHVSRSNVSKTKQSHIFHMLLDSQHHKGIYMTKAILKSRSRLKVKCLKDETIGATLASNFIYTVLIKIHSREVNIMIQSR